MNVPIFFPTLLLTHDRVQIVNRRHRLVRCIIHRQIPIHSTGTIKAKTHKIAKVQGKGSLLSASTTSLIPRSLFFSIINFNKCSPIYNFFSNFKAL